MAASFSLPKGSVTDRTCMLNVLFKSFIGDIHMFMECLFFVVRLVFSCIARCIKDFIEI